MGKVGRGVAEKRQTLEACGNWRRMMEERWQTKERMRVARGY